MLKDSDPIYKEDEEIAAIKAAYARPNNTDIQKRLDVGNMHTLVPPSQIFTVMHIRPYGKAVHRAPITQRWFEYSGIGKSGPDRPWLPISLNVYYGLGTDHAMFLLLNRATGHAYLFEPGGLDDRSSRVIYAFVGLPNLYRTLVANGGLLPSEWRTTTFVTDVPVMYSVFGRGPQGQQGERTSLLGAGDGTCAAWSFLFYHLFILHPELDPNAVLKRMLAPELRPYLGQIIGRYSMFIAKNIVAKITRHNAKYAK
jgi:hypothetical protein